MPYEEVSIVHTKSVCIICGTTGLHLSEECSQWQRYQKLLRARRQCSTAPEVLPEILWGTV